MNQLIILLCLVSSVALAQDSSAINTELESTRASIPRNLLATSPPVSLGVPALSFRGEPACDSAGNVYLEIVNPQHMENGAGPFLGIKFDGKSHTLFSVPDELSDEHKKPGITLQAVSPKGDYFLLYTDFSKYTLIGYNDDGSERGRTVLNVPANVSPEWIAIADSGTSFIQGYLDSTKNADGSRKPFAATFDTTGKLSRNLSSGLQDISLSSVNSLPLEGGLVAGDDGRFYMLQGDAILVLNQNGERLQKIALHKPDPSSIAVRLDVSKGIVAVKLVSLESKPGKAPIINQRFLLFDAQTGQPRGDYVLDPKQFFNYLLCFTRDHGYSVYALKDGQAAMQLLPID